MAWSETLEDISSESFLDLRGHEAFSDRRFECSDGCLQLRHQLDHLILWHFLTSDLDPFFTSTFLIMNIHHWSSSVKY